MYWKEAERHIFILWNVFMLKHDVIGVFWPNIEPENLYTFSITFFSINPLKVVPRYEQWQLPLLFFFFFFLIFFVSRFKVWTSPCNCMFIQHSILQNNSTGWQQCHALVVSLVLNNSHQRRNTPAAIYVVSYAPAQLPKESDRGRTVVLCALEKRGKCQECTIKTRIQSPLSKHRYGPKKQHCRTQV